jgi:hypothetical protein
LGAISYQWLQNTRNAGRQFSWTISLSWKYSGRSNWSMREPEWVNCMGHLIEAIFERELRETATEAEAE